MIHSIKNISLYPIKGMAGFSVQEAIVQNDGIANDRNYMLVDKNAKCYTQRESSDMVFFKTRIENGQIVVNFKDNEIAIPQASKGTSQKKVTIWEHELNADVMEKQFNDWFSDKLDTDVTLVKMNKEHPRIKKLKVKPFSSEIRFTDGYPFTFLGTASMDLLNSKLEEKLSASRFRSSFLVSTEEAHEEDSWKDFSLGTARFRMVKPCSRCVVTTIDQENGSKTKEPLRTLSTYRKFDNHVNFTMNAICLNPGRVSVGDQIKLEA